MTHAESLLRSWAKLGGDFPPESLCCGSLDEAAAVEAYRHGTAAVRAVLNHACRDNDWSCYFDLSDGSCGFAANQARLAVGAALRAVGLRSL